MRQSIYRLQRYGFNTQPRGGGCYWQPEFSVLTQAVSTHSRAEAAAIGKNQLVAHNFVSTHSRAEAAALRLLLLPTRRRSFNTQPRGGGCYQ